MVRRTLQAAVGVLALCAFSVLPGFAQSQPQGQEDMQKQLDKLKSETAQMQERMSKLRQKLTELAQSGASAEEIQKAMEELNKEFGFGSAQKPAAEEKHEEKAARETPAKEEKQQPTREQPAVWLGFNGEETDEGFEVTIFNKNSPAKKAGLKIGDIVVKFNGEEVSTAVEIVEKEMPLKPGDKATLTLLRDGAEMTLELVMEGRPETIEAEDQPKKEEDDEAEEDMHKDHKHDDKEHEDEDDEDMHKDHKHHDKDDKDNEDDDDRN